MKKKTLSLALLGTVLVPLLHAAPAQAQQTRTWVSATGADANPCSRTAPCQTFSGAISKTAENGEIDCIDPGGFGSVTISKSITIDCTGTFGSILASGTNGVIVNNATPTVSLRVVLRGLSINGAGPCAVGAPSGCSPASPGLNGVRFLTGGTLHVDNVMVQNFTGAGNGFGIDFRPANTAKLIVSNSYFFNNGNATTGAAIQIRPTAGAATALIERTVADAGRAGFVADSAGGTTGINMAVHDSKVHGSTGDGILATSAGVAVGVLVDRSAVTSNSVGLHANGNTTAIVRVGSSMITGNGTATSATAGGQVLSYLNNEINGNGVDTVPPTAGGLH